MDEENLKYIAILSVKEGNSESPKASMTLSYSLMLKGWNSRIENEMKSNDDGGGEIKPESDVRRSGKLVLGEQD